MAADDPSDFLQYLRSSAWNNKRNSDVIIEVLGEEYYLHKVILEQSPYFVSMFSSSWKQADDNRVKINLDHEATAKSVRQALQSLYGYRAKLESVEDAVNLFASASYFGLEHVRQQCEKYLLENISLESVHSCYKFFHHTCTPGGDTILSACRSLLVRKCYQMPECLVRLPRDVIKDVLTNNALCVPGGEYERYKLIETVFRLVEDAARTPSVVSTEKESGSETQEPADEADWSPELISLASDVNCEKSESPALYPSKRLRSLCGSIGDDREPPELSLRNEVLSTIFFSAFSLHELFETKSKEVCESLLTEGLWRRQRALAYITKAVDASHLAQLENFRHCVVFQGSKLRVDVPQDVYSDPFVAFGSMWQAKVRLQANPKDREKKTMSCHLHRQTLKNNELLHAPLAQPEYVDMELMRKFKFSVCVPVPAGGPVVREGTAEFALKNDPRLPQADINKYGWGWDSILEYADLATILTDDKLHVIITICPVIQFKAESS